MNKYLNFIKLDILTIKPYLGIKYIALYVALSAFIGINSDSTVGVGSMMGLISINYISSVFAVSEKNQLDTLYNILGIHRQHVVLGRQLFIHSFTLATAVFAYLLLFALSLIQQIPFNFLESLKLTVLLYLAFTFLSAIQLPIYFKWGAIKSKLMTLIPLFAVPALGAGIYRILTQAQISWLLGHQGVLIAVGLAIWFLVQVLAHLLALKFYQAKEL